MKKKTLFLSDLDGTLLTPRQNLSPFTVQSINALTEKGLIFSYATARSHHSASRATQGLQLHSPLIFHNGVFIMENITWKKLHACYFTREEAANILLILQSHGVEPMIYTSIEDVSKNSYVPEKISRGIVNFIKTRPNDPRHRPVTEERMLDGDIFYFLCIDDDEKLSPCHEKLKKQFQCTYQIDMYDGEHWLEIMPSSATKANAALRLKEMLGCEKIVAFGDGINDLPLFEIADECYAMENAVPELKKAATAVIDSNEEDGVAKWLIENWDQ